MSCGQCIRKVLKAAEPLTKHTLKLAHAHTHCHRHRHTQPHQAPYTNRHLTHTTETKAHSARLTVGHKDTLSHTGSTHSEGTHVHLRLQRNQMDPRRQKGIISQARTHTHSDKGHSLPWTPIYMHLYPRIATI